MLTALARRGLASLMLCAALVPAGALAAPGQYVPVNDPIFAEMRVLDLFSHRWGLWMPRPPHPGTLPTRYGELFRPTNWSRERRMDFVISGSAPGPVSLSETRIRRAVARDFGWLAEADSFPRSTPRLYQQLVGNDTHLEVSAALEGALDSDRDTTLFRSGSGAHLRIGLETDRWFAFSDLVVGRFDGAREFADPIVANTDVTTLTEDSYLGYAAASGNWSARLGRSRWHWGPGDEGSLILSRTSAPLTGLEFQANLGSPSVHLVALNATLDAAAGEQLAAHRIEWAIDDGRLRLGATEASRYHASGWSPLYAVGVIPYVLVQRLEVQDARDSAGTLRNNVMVGGDASWRVADGTRVYGELAIDDLHAKTNDNPNKLAWQLGWDGAGMIGAQRFVWNGELTRVWRYVYTSFFGRAYEAQGRPLGFPTGPDSRRVAARMAWDPNADWQVFARAVQTDLGEGTLEQPFVPGSEKFSGSEFQGVVERTRSADLGVRWWPASGVDISLSGGWQKTDNLDHVARASHQTPRVTLEMRLIR